MSEAEDPYLSPPVQRAARLLRHIAGGDAVTNMAATARALDINRTTLLRLLHTLEAEGFIEPRGGGKPGWRVGLALFGLVARAFASEDLAEIATPILDAMAHELGFSTHLGVLDGREVVYLIRRTPDHSFVSNIRVGSRLPAHAANMGRAILAHWPAEQLRQLFTGASMPAVTAQTPTSLPALLAQLAADRADGLAWSEGFYEAGIASVAAPVFDATGRPVAAINLSGGAAEFAASRPRIDQAMRRAAEEISRRLGWTG
jgi:DNA-binding IclR family transcriptional regulator